MQLVLFSLNKCEKLYIQYEISDERNAFWVGWNEKKFQIKNETNKQTKNKNKICINSKEQWNRRQLLASINLNKCSNGFLFHFGSAVFLFLNSNRRTVTIKRRENPFESSLKIVAESLDLVIWFNILYFRWIDIFCRTNEKSVIVFLFFFRKAQILANERLNNINKQSLLNRPLLLQLMIIASKWLCVTIYRNTALELLKWAREKIVAFSLWKIMKNLPFHWHRKKKTQQIYSQCQ